MKTTQEYFNLSVDELLTIKNKFGYTKEECLLLDEGIEIIFFDNEEELEEEKK